jgi:hypothetical protein
VRRFERLRDERGAKDGTVFLTNGAIRVVRCADPCLLFSGLADRLWYGRGNVPPEQEAEKRYGWLLDILQAENVESFRSADRFFDNVANQVIFETRKGDAPLCQMRIE